MAKFKPGMLSSKSLRNSGSKNPLAAEVADFIDHLSQQYDALSKLHSTPDPDSTKTGHALKVRNAVVRSMESNSKRTLSLVEKLANHESMLWHRAQERAGLLQPFPEAHLSELRSALRQMSFSEREKAIRSAFERGDVAVMRAVKEASSPILVGEHKVPLDTLTQTFIHQHNPELAQEMEEAKALTQRLDIVTDSFVGAVGEMRDHGLEAQAEEHRQITQEAMAKLG